jgi:hypothetical protein
MSLDKGDCSLRLSWPWGEIAANHVMFDHHDGPFKAIVEPSRAGVRVTFDGWVKDRFTVSADRVRIVYWNGSRKEIDFVAELIQGRSAVRIRPVDRPVAEGTRIVLRLGEHDRKAITKVSPEATKK